MQLLIVPRPSGIKLEMDVGGGNQSVSAAGGGAGTKAPIWGFLIDQRGRRCRRWIRDLQGVFLVVCSEFSF